MFQNPTLKVLLTSDQAKSPSKAHDDDSCFDFFAAEDCIVRNGDTQLIDLGCKVIIPEGYDMVIREKSGLASKGIIVGAGEIDNGYRGPLKAVVRFIKPLDAQYEQNYFSFFSGDKVCQGRLVRKINTHIEQISKSNFSSNTSRGEGGFGSSGN